LLCVIQDVHQTGVQSLADWTAVCIQLYYGIAQSMLLDQPCDVLLYAQKAANLARLLATQVIYTGCTQIMEYHGI